MGIKSFTSSPQLIRRGGQCLCRTYAIKINLLVSMIFVLITDNSQFLLCKGFDVHVPGIVA